MLIIWPTFVVSAKGAKSISSKKWFITLTLGTKEKAKKKTKFEKKELDIFLRWRRSFIRLAAASGHDRDSKKQINFYEEEKKAKDKVSLQGQIRVPRFATFWHLTNRQARETNTKVTDPCDQMEFFQYLAFSTLNICLTT